MVSKASIKSMKVGSIEGSDGRFPNWRSRECDASERVPQLGGLKGGELRHGMLFGGGVMANGNSCRERVLRLRYA